MKFKDVFFSKEDRFSVGIEEETKKYFLSIPVTSGIVDYEEYYEISKEDFDKFQTGLDHLKKIAKACKERKNDSKLILKPGKNRGVPD